jgi:hypothetical protein
MYARRWQGILDADDCQWLSDRLVSKISIAFAPVSCNISPMFFTLTVIVVRGLVQCEMKRIPILGLEHRYPAWEASMLTTYIISDDECNQCTPWSKILTILLTTVQHHTSPNESLDSTDKQNWFQYNHDMTKWNILLKWELIRALSLSIPPNSSLQLLQTNKLVGLDLFIAWIVIGPIIGTSLYTLPITFRYSRLIK